MTPAYVYLCGCGALATISHSIGDDPVMRCLECGDVMVRKPALGGVAFIGDGWAGKETK